MSWNKVKLGQFLKVRKGKFKPNDPEIAELKRVDKIDFSGKVHLSTKSSNTDMIVIKKGDLLISGINVAKGAVTVYEGEEDVVATIHYSSYEFDETKIDVTFLKLFLQIPEFFDAIREQIPGGIKTEIKSKHLLPLEVVIPSLDEQKKIAALFFEFLAKQKTLDNQLDKQLTYLTQLRQALLREAMQGQLLPQNPTDEPAAVLLQKLQAAKATAGKAGKRKAGPLFTEEAQAVEGPYDLPKEWTWCKLGELVERSDSGWSPACANYPATEGVWGVLRTTSVQKLQFLAEENKQLPASLTPRPQYEVQAGDILITRAGPKNRGVCCVVDEVRPKLMISDKLIRLHLYEQQAYPKFIALALNIGVSAQFLEDVKTGMADSQVNISQDNLRATIIPLPPIAEQHRIVAKLEQLLQHCDALEQRIRESRRLAEQLLQTALREALAPPAGGPASAAAELELAQVSASAPRARRTAARGTQLALGGLLD